MATRRFLLTSPIVTIAGHKREFAFEISCLEDDMKQKRNETIYDQN